MNRCNLGCKLFVCLLSFCAILPAVRAKAAQATQPSPSAKKKPTQTNPSPANQTSYSPFDAIAQKLSSDTFDKSSLTTCDEKNEKGQAVTFAEAITAFVQYAKTTDAVCIVAKVASAHSGSPKSEELLADGNAVILHVMTWRRLVVKAKDPNYKGNTLQYQPQKGAWALYRIRKKKDKSATFEQQLDLSGTPYFFRAKHIYVMDVNSGEVVCDNQNDNPVCTPPIDIAYDIETTARQKQNQSDLATLVSTLLKTSTGTTQNAQGLAAPTPIYWGTVTTVAPTVPVPYDVAVTATYSASQDSFLQSATISVQLACNVVQPKGQNATGDQDTTGGQNQPNNQGAPAGLGGPSDQDVSDSHDESSSQSGSPSTSKAKPQGAQSSSTSCSVSRTVAHYDPEFWDVSVGMAIPGPIEMTYKSSTSSSSSSTTSGSTTVTPSKVTHTDAYAFFDIYLGEFSSRTAPATLSMFPHINAGIPITGQTLHRPYVGLAENLGFLTKHAKLNIPLSVFAGPVFMKQQVELPGTTTLKWDRATKMIYGVELPISSITNFFKSSGGSKNSSSSKNNSGGSSSQ